MSEEICRNKSDFKNSIITKKFQIRLKHSLGGRDKYPREITDRLLKCLTMQLMKRSESDEHIGKAFKLLSDFDMKS